MQKVPCFRDFRRYRLLRHHGDADDVNALAVESSLLDATRSRAVVETKFQGIRPHQRRTRAAQDEQTKRSERSLRGQRITEVRRKRPHKHPLQLRGTLKSFFGWGCGQKPGPKKRGKCPCIPMTKECEQYSFILSCHRRSILT